MKKKLFNKRGCRGEKAGNWFYGNISVRNAAGTVSYGNDAL